MLDRILKRRESLTADVFWTLMMECSKMLTASGIHHSIIGHPVGFPAGSTPGAAKVLLTTQNQSYVSIAKKESTYPVLAIVIEEDCIIVTNSIQNGLCVKNPIRRPGPIY